MTEVESTYAELLHARETLLADLQRRDEVLREAHLESAKFEAEIETWKWRHDQMQERVRILENRIGFANMDIGSCVYCTVGNKPGPHHSMHCPLWREQ